MPSSDKKPVLVSYEDHAWIFDYADRTNRTAGQVVTELVSKARVSEKRREYMRGLRVARSRLNRAG